MKNVIKNIPSGTRDLIYEEALIPGKIEDALLDIYFRLGYKPVSTPELEYYKTIDHVFRHGR